MKLLLSLICNKPYSDFRTFLIKKCTNQTTKYSRDSFQILIKHFLIRFVMLLLISPAPSLQCSTVSQVEKVLAL